MNARMNAWIRRNRGRFMGMDVLILHTVGRRSGRAPVRGAEFRALPVRAAGRPIKTEADPVDETPPLKR
jgi:hypothetical protein